MKISDRNIQLCMLELLGRRAPTASICPSDVARQLIPDDETAWRQLMPAIRQVAARLAQEGSIVITQGAVTVSPESIIRGPIRLRRGAKFPVA
ncbi:DUF3253 domain-containing protein [Caballeronia sp. LZ016]|uniref:DUF3253 domain-containing protein n=1 Tax=Caballeronia sp. LZ016 TaxID=3038554 RepID=UPI002855434C|nr:DUF3253 domain-containing protein [Caballeronia sp. LZ016]MDR5739253.1 DUF3253 domain-containing protein [Caballeronia sp. LZ016]